MLWIEFGWGLLHAKLKLYHSAMVPPQIAELKVFYPSLAFWDRSPRHAVTGNNLKRTFLTIKRQLVKEAQEIKPDATSAEEQWRANNEMWASTQDWNRPKVCLKKTVFS